MSDLSRLRDVGVSIHVIATGAGAGMQQALWSVPGASAYLSGCSFPYATEELVEVLGFAPEHACSEATAIDLASAAYMKAYRFGGKAPVGVGLTAAVPTIRERRGQDRVHACVITDTAVLVSSHALEKGKHDRAGAGRWCDRLALELLEQALELEHGVGVAAPAFALSRFLVRPYFRETGERLGALPEGTHALMPGAFNPPHLGHLGIAAHVERMHHVPVVFHVTASAPHKGQLTVQELLKRAKLLRGERVLFTTGEALYIDKARRFPEMPLVMGADALFRMLDPKWGPEITAMLCEFSQLGTTFFVVPRDGLTVDRCFELSGVRPDFRDLFVEVDYRSDESSSAIREPAR